VYGNRAVDPLLAGATALDRASATCPATDSEQPATAANVNIP
jgi:hypothetical protein